MSRPMFGVACSKERHQTWKLPARVQYNTIVMTHNHCYCSIIIAKCQKQYVIAQGHPFRGVQCVCNSEGKVLAGVRNCDKDRRCKRL